MTQALGESHGDVGDAPGIRARPARRYMERRSPRRADQSGRMRSLRKIRSLHDQAKDALKIAVARPLRQITGTPAVALNVENGACNPSVVVWRGKLMAAVRVPAYRLEHGGLYRILLDQGLASRTLLVELDTDLRPLETREIDTALVRNTYVEAQDGLEDPRLFVSNDRLMCLWSGLNTGVPETSSLQRGTLWRPNWTATRNCMIVADITDGAVSSARVMPSPFGNSREKNWMPESPSTHPTFCYRIANGTMVQLMGGSLATASRSSIDERFDGWSGSSQMIPWGGGRLAVIHRAFRGNAFWKGLRPAVYLHKFVHILETGEMRESAPFFFLKRGIEFCAGIARVGDDLVLSFGFEDSSAYLTRIRPDDLERLMRKI